MQLLHLRFSTSICRWALRLAATPSVASAVVAPAVIAWRKRFPSMRCELSTYHTNDIVARLLVGLAHGDPIGALVLAMVAAGHGVALIDPFKAASMNATVVQTRPCALTQIVAINSFWL
jgi:DNA-binding transcriptional LysR family regulator